MIAAAAAAASTPLNFLASTPDVVRRRPVRHPLWLQIEQHAQPGQKSLSPHRPSQISTPLPPTTLLTSNNAQGERNGAPVRLTTSESKLTSMR